MRERLEFLRWNEPDYYGATREREEESAAQPGAREHWEEAIQRYMPPVQTWIQERWDIEKAYFSNAPDKEDDEVEVEDMDLDEEWYSEIEEDDSLPVGFVEQGFP